MIVNYTMCTQKWIHIGKTIFPSIKAGQRLWELAQKGQASHEIFRQTQTRKEGGFFSALCGLYGLDIEQEAFYYNFRLKGRRLELKGGNDE